MTATGSVGTVVQVIGDAKLSVDCKVKPLAVLGQRRMTLPPDSVMLSSTDPPPCPEVNLKIVPALEVPSSVAVPNIPFPAKTRAAWG